MANMVNVVNYILGSASDDYQARVPVATDSNIREVGSAIMNYRATENEFLGALVNKVAMQIIHNKTFSNPLSVLKKGGVPLGRNIEEIYTNPAVGSTFDASGADLLAKAIPDTKTIYHEMNRRGKYKVTISKSQLLQAFTSYGALEELLNTIVNTIYSGDNIEEFMLMKQLVGSSIVGGKIKRMPISRLDGSMDSAKAFVKTVRTIGQDMVFPSSKYNTYADINKDVEGVTPAVTWTPLENQILLLRNDVSVDVDVELLAHAFNVSYTDLKQRTLIVDNFGFDADKNPIDCAAMLCDEAFFQVRDNLVTTDMFHNPEGLYDNFIHHHWQTYSVSLFANAVAFMFDDVAVDGE